MRKTLIIICFFLLKSCDFSFDRKITVDEFINEELKSFNWDDVDQYPVFENCLGFENVIDKNNCFVQIITETFSANLKNNNLVLNRTLVDTLNMVLKVNKTGQIKIENINILNQKIEYEEFIIKSFDNTISNLPKIYPAIKRGQYVDVVFNIPIIITTEN